MAEQPVQAASFDATEDQPLIAVPLEENGRRIVRYFVDTKVADRELAKLSPRDGCHLAGIWKDLDPDLDWDELADELDRVRHESKPTPPIEFDDLGL